MDDERRNANRRQDVADVDLEVHPPERCDRARARAHAGVRRPPTHELLVAGQARRHPTRDSVPRRLVRSPAALGLLDPPQRLLPRPLPGRLLRPGQRRPVRAVENRSGRPLRIRRGEEHRHRSALGDAEERRALRARRVHHRPHVVHSRLEARDPADAIGEAGAALVEQDQAPHRRQPLVEVDVAAVLPRQLDVRHEPGHDHDVVLALADNLERDRHVPAARVLSLGCGDHGRSLRPRARWGKRPHG